MSDGLPPIPRVAISISEWCRATGCSRSWTYTLIAKGEVRTVKIAGRRLIPANEVQRLFGEKNVA